MNANLTIRERMRERPILLHGGSAIGFLYAMAIALLFTDLAADWNARAAGLVDVALGAGTPLLVLYTLFELKTFLTRTRNDPACQGATDELGRGRKFVAFVLAQFISLFGIWMLIALPPSTRFPVTAATFGVTCLLLGLITLIPFFQKQSKEK